MQKLLINYLLKPLGKIMDHINPKVKDAIFLVSAVIIASINCLHFAGVLPYRYLVIYAGGCAFLGLMILVSLTGDIRPVRFRPWLMVPWFITGGFMALSGILHGSEYLMDAVFFLVVYPVLFIVWNQGNFAKVMNLLVKAIVIVLIAVFAVNACMFPVTTERYEGLFRNTNAAAFFYAPAFGCLLIKLYQTKKFTWKTVGVLVLLGMTAAVMYYSNSRTGQLAIIFELIVATVLYFVMHLRSAGKFLVYKILPLVLSVIIFFPTTLYLLQIPGVIVNKISDPQAMESTQVVADPEDEQEEKKSDKKKPAKKDSIHGLGGFLKTNNEKLSADGKTIDDFSSYRVTIWKLYIEKLNLLGNSPDVEIKRYEDGISYTAHNIWLEYSFQSGLPCGIAYLIFNILAGVLSIGYAWNHKGEKYSLLPLTMAIGYGVIAVLSSVNTPFMYICTMYYMFAQGPIVSKAGRK